MQKLLAIFFSLSLFISVLGYHWWFFIQQASIKTAVKENLKHPSQRQHTVTFTFAIHSSSANDNPDWDGDDEFSYRGEMYDVLQKEIKGDSVTVRCISDKKETELINAYNKIAKGDFGNSPKKKTASILKLMNSFVACVTENTAETPAADTKQSYSLYQSSLPGCNHDVQSPPPKFV